MLPDEVRFGELFLDGRSLTILERKGVQRRDALSDYSSASSGAKWRLNGVR